MDQEYKDFCEQNYLELNTEESYVEYRESLELSKEEYDEYQR